MIKLLTECLVIWWLKTGCLLWLDGNNLPNDQHHSILFLWAFSHLFCSWVLLRWELKVERIWFLQQCDGAQIHSRAGIHTGIHSSAITLPLLFVSGVYIFLPKSPPIIPKKQPLGTSHYPQNLNKIGNTCPSFPHPFSFSQAVLFNQVILTSGCGEASEQSLADKALQTNPDSRSPPPL